MRRIIVVLAAMAAMAVVYAGAAWATSVSEVEPNDWIGQAQNIDSYFSLDSDPNIARSTTVPHATVDGTGDGTFDYYAFSVPQAGVATIGLFDIDGAIVCPPESGICEGFDSYVQLYDTNGNFLAQDDDGGIEDPGSEGSFALDSSLEYNFPSAGTYYIAVGSCCVGPVPDGVTYQLHVSLGDSPFSCQGVPPTIEAQQGRTLKGTRGDDVILGTRGADTINGNGGNDIICGWLGNDSISGGDGHDLMLGGDGNDRIKGDRGEDSLYGEGGDDTLDGGLGPDYINGGEGTDTCSLGEYGRDECELAIGPNANP
jgi:serralysin